jgi:hypothetical protein
VAAVPRLARGVERPHHDDAARDPQCISSPPLGPAILSRQPPDGHPAGRDRPGASPDNIFWTANLAEAGHFIHGFESVWLPASLLNAENGATLVEALVAASRHWSVELHLQKGLAGGSAMALAATRQTPMNPAVLDAFCLAIIAGESPPAFPGLKGHEPDLDAARHDAGAIEVASRALTSLVPWPSAYVAECSYFQRGWQAAYWGPNYPRLLDIKKRYDPAGLFVVHHGVGSEDWSADGFTRLGR